MLAVANDDVRVRTKDAARHAGAVIANLAAYPFGIGGVGECKPQGGGCDADEEFGHRQPPLRPLRSASAVPRPIKFRGYGLVPDKPASSSRRACPTTAEQKIYGFLCRRYNYLRGFCFTHCRANSPR